MKVARTPEALWSLATALKEEGCHGFLLSGGCDRRGIVPLAPFAEVLARVKERLGFKTAIHTKLLDEPLAEALSHARIDLAMVDIVGDDETLRQVYNLRDRTVADFERTLGLAGQYGLPLAPHVVAGAHDGEFRGEDRALDMLRGHKLSSLVIVLLMPLSQAERKAIAPPDLDEVLRFFRRARRIVPDTPLLLGCARPMGEIQRRIDAAALQAGFDGIAYPSEGTVALAREMGLRPVFSEYCCGLMC